MCIIYCCITNYPKTKWLKKHLLSLGLESGHDLAGSSGSGFFKNLKLKCGPSYSGMVQAWLVEDPFPSSLTWLLAGISSFPHGPLHRAAHSVVAYISCNLSSEVKSYHFRCILLYVRSKSLGPAHTWRRRLHNSTNMGHRDHWQPF